MGAPPPAPSRKAKPELVSLLSLPLSLSRERALVRDGGRGSLLPLPSPGDADAAAGDPTRPSLFYVLRYMDAHGVIVMSQERGGGGFQIL